MELEPQQNQPEKLENNSAAPKEILEKSNSELASLIKESAQNIRQADIPKRGPGRPPGTGKHQKAAHGAPQPPPPKIEAQPMPDIAEHLIPPLLAVSKIPAVKYSIPELALDSTEAAACAQSLQMVLNAFVPDLATMSPKTAAILAAAVTFGSIGVSKMQIYALTMQARAHAEPEPKTVETAPTPSPAQAFPVEATGSAGLFKNIG